MSNIAEIIVGSVGVLGALGAAGKFIWDKLEGRFIGIESALAECHANHATSLARRAKQLTVIELLWFELQRFAPNSPIFARVEKLLDDLKPQSGDKS